MCEWSPESVCIVDTGQPSLAWIPFIRGILTKPFAIQVSLKY